MRGSFMFGAASKTAGAHTGAPARRTVCVVVFGLAQRPPLPGRGRGSLVCSGRDVSRPYGGSRLTCTRQWCGRGMASPLRRKPHICCRGGAMPRPPSSAYIQATIETSNWPPHHRLRRSFSSRRSQRVTPVFSVTSQQPKGKPTIALASPWGEAVGLPTDEVASSSYTQQTKHTTKPLPQGERTATCKPLTTATLGAQDKSPALFLNGSGGTRNKSTKKGKPK